MRSDTLENAFIIKLSEIVGEKNVHFGEDIGADFTHDELPGGRAFPPDVVVEPSSTEEVSAILSACCAEGVPVVARGAGTGQVGGSVPVQGGVVLSLKSMSRTLSFDEDSHTITVQPGVLLQDVKAAAESHGLYYPPDPGEQTATIGGNAATNASGPCAVKYGRTRDYIQDAVIVQADGSIHTLADTADLEVCLGSEGCLGIITELKLKLVEKPGANAILLFPFLDTETAIQAAKTILSSEFAPSVVEYMDTDLVEFSGNVTRNPVFPVEMDGERTGATLMVNLEGPDDDTVMEMMEDFAEKAEDLECLDILVGDSPTMIRDFWAAHTAFHTSMESGCKSAWEVNVDLPVDSIPEMIAYAKATAEEKGMRALIHSHVGSGGTHIHLASNQNRTEAAPVAAALYDLLYTKTVELGGDIRGEYGIGYAKTAYFSEAAKKAFAAAKTKLDPCGILNPGKIT